MTGLPMDRAKALALVIRYLTLYPEQFSKFLAETYLHSASAIDNQDVVVADDLWDMLTDTAQRVVNELSQLRNGVNGEH